MPQHPNDVALRCSSAKLFLYQQFALQQSCGWLAPWLGLAGSGCCFDGMSGLADSGALLAASSTEYRAH